MQVPVHRAISPSLIFFFISITTAATSATILGEGSTWKYYSYFKDKKSKLREIKLVGYVDSLNE